ncbi:MAG TPA: ankyrin repeat domain-containing protein [Thermoanaerobaculia bacterium]|nr:ankyrin repeat domain-containing protein [Thermoanaerobaculia bacterium]
MAGSNPFVACCAGDADAVAALLDEDPARRSAPHLAGEGFTPLLYACASPLHTASAARAQGIVRCAELLLDRGASPNEHMLYDGDPKSPIPALYFACVADNRPLVKLLLERGADPNDGESIYHSAELDHRECLELLAAHGADVGGRHAHWGNTPLYFLAGYREGNPAAAKAYAGMRWLLEHGADPNVTSAEREETPLHQVARNTQTAAVAEMLLAHGASVDPQSTDDRTPFVLATRAGNVAVAQLLRERGADVTRLTPADEFLGACLTADEPKARALAAADPSLVARLAEADLHGLLHTGANAKSEAVLRLMHALGFDLRSESQWGGTPLHWAAWQGDVGLVKLLLSLDAPVNVRDKQFGSSPLGWAAHGSANCRHADDEYAAIIELLLDAGADRESTINRWGGPPEALSTRRIARLLRRRGFAPA